MSIPSLLRTDAGRCATGALAVLVVTQLLPGQQGGHGTPAAILYRGLALGLVAALTAAGLILVYRTLRVINFAQTSLGAIGAVFTFSLTQYTPVPFLVALPLGLALSALVGLAVGLVCLRFSQAPRLVLTVFTVVLVQVLVIGSALITSLPIFPPAESLSPLEQLGQGTVREHLPFASWHYHVGGLAIPYGFTEVFAIVTALVALGALTAFLRLSRVGVAVRAMAENTDQASLLGIGVGGLSCLVWVLASVLSGLGITLAGAMTSPQTATGGGLTVLVPALVAAVIAGMESIPLGAAAAVLLAILGEAWTWSFRDDIVVFDVVLLVLLLAGLLARRRRALRSEHRGEASAWAALLEPRAIPKELAALPLVRVGRIGLIALLVLGAGVFPFAVGPGATNLASVIALNAIIVLSLVVLTGWAGQVSLAQFALAGVGAVVCGALASRVGMPFPVAVLGGTLVTAGVAVLLGIPALRIHGLFLLPASFAFAVVVEHVLFSTRYFGWLLPRSVTRPSLGFLDFEDERAMYFLCLTLAIGCAASVARLRRTWIGRTLIALRDNEPSVRAYGISALRMRVLGFAISGALAGFGGAVFAYQQRGVSAASFGADSSVAVFVQAIFGGVGSVGGAVLGALYFNVLQYFATSPLVLIFAGPLTTAALLFAAPGGVVSLLMAARDALLKVVALQHGIASAALLGQRNADAVATRRWPLAEAQPGRGLSALPPTRRYTLGSQVHGRRVVAGRRSGAA